ncbi:MAG: O-methyltransferase [Bacteroidales bacterium]
MLQIPKEIEKYLIEHSDKEDDLLSELYRETHKKVLHPRMLSGPIQGKLIEMITKMINPQNVLEIGTYTGYSAICIAKGLNKGAQIHTIEINDELEEFIRHYFKRSGLENRIHLHIGNALKIIEQLPISFDMVFIDGNKSEYPEYLEKCKHKLNPGGFIIADNVFWDGKVLRDTKNADYHTQGIKTFNKMVQRTPQLENIMLPLRDGLNIIRKKTNI